MYRFALLKERTPPSPSDIYTRYARIDWNLNTTLRTQVSHTYVWETNLTAIKRFRSLADFSIQIRFCGLPQNRTSLNRDVMCNCKFPPIKIFINTTVFPSLMTRNRQTPTSEGWKGIPWTDPEDAVLMASCYDSNPEKLDGVKGEDLVDNIEWRIYTEWCCNRDESVWEDHVRYHGQGLSNWVRNETHFTLERAGYEWDSREGRFNANGSFDETYRATRADVLKAVVRRAFDFFKDCKDYKWVPDGNPENLRVSLEQYMG